MDIFERFNSKFGKWYEGLFGSDAGELRPKDVLRKIIAAMEDHRKEGFDSKIYVPNKYILELAVEDPEEREYLLSFLDEEELVGVLQKFMAQNGYKTRGPLDFTIAEVPEEEREAHQEKLRVKVRYEKGEKELPPTPNSGGVGKETSPAAARLPLLDKERAGVRSPTSPILEAEGLVSDDLPTVAGVSFEDEDEFTVPAIAWASLAVTNPEGRKSLFSLTKPIVQIGRSRNAANDLILDTDGMVSKSHARLERERDGSWTLYDLGSTNGVRVNGSRIDGNHVLCDGNEIGIGGTALLFQQAEVRPTDAPAPLPAALPSRRARLIGPDGEVYVLASETLVGRAVTSDIVLSDPTVATKHARVIAPNDTSCTLEDLGSENGTRVNDRLLPTGRRLPLSDGDVILFGHYEMHFSAGGQ